LNGRKLFTVEETFTIHHRGTILVPGLLAERNECFRIGDPLRLVRPDGSELTVTIRGLDLFNRGPKGEIAVLVELQKSEVPLGTEVWSL
jgi:hypothetical protein